MPYTQANPPSFVKNKSKEEIKVAVDVANAVLAKGASENDAIFAAIAAVKTYNRKQSQQKAVEASKRSLPSHVSALLQKAVVEAVEVPEEQPRIRKEFLGKNALPVGTERNLVSVTLLDTNELLHTFDTGEQIRVDLSSLGNTESYVTISPNVIQEGGSGGALNSTSVLVNTVANTPLIVEHNLGLLDPERLIISSFLNGRLVELDIQILDGNSVEVTTLVDITGLKLNFLGV